MKKPIKVHMFPKMLENGQEKHLHVTVSQDVEPIIEGDWYIYLNQLMQAKNLIGFDESVKNDCRKIIATTDTKFNFNGGLNPSAEMLRGTKFIPKIRPSTIQQFVANPDGEWEVEYEPICCGNYTLCNSNCTIKGFKLKLNQDNTVNITSVEEKMYSRGEVEALLHSAVNDSHCSISTIKQPNSNKCAGFVINWVKDNLK
jgi:hypothetical protein